MDLFLLFAIHYNFSIEEIKRHYWSIVDGVDLPMLARLPSFFGSQLLSSRLGGADGSRTHNWSETHFHELV